MRFTQHQYDEAIAALQEAKKQLEPNGLCCSICTDSGHTAYECGMNPLVAVMMCIEISKHSDALHDTLHHLAGNNNSFGEQLGPTRCSLPEGIL